jgi:hypothetical protein
MSQALAPADVAHYYQRLAELSTLLFWQLPDFGEPSGPERGHVWHWQDICAISASRPTGLESTFTPPPP